MVCVGLCPCDEMEIITRISTVPMIIMIVWFVNIFMDFFISLFLMGDVIIMKISGRVINIFDFLIFLSSFGAMDAVYIKRVIIPDENVIITMKDSHLDIVTLNRMYVIIMDMMMIIIAIFRGVVFVILIIIRMIRVEVIFHYFL